MSNDLPVPSFEALIAIATHIEQRTMLANYINGKSSLPPDMAITNCTTDCLFARWLYQQGCKDLSDFRLLDEICNACEVFQSVASDAVLLKSIGKGELSREMLLGGGIYSEASAEFQRNLVRLHYQLSAASKKRSSRFSCGGEAVQD